VSRSWAEEEVADALAGGLLAVASYSEHRPEVADSLRAAVLAKIGDRERDLIQRLAEEMRP
jgi:hypothetical protein